MAADAESTPLKTDQIQPAGRSRHLLQCVGVALLAGALSLAFFSPRLWLMREPVAGSFQWARADGFLLQCEDPFRRDVEPALHWRFLPPLICHHLGLRGQGALVFPWIGVLAMLTFAAGALHSRLGSWRLAAPVCVLLATTSGVITATNYLGTNDGWSWLGLLYVGFARPRWALPLVALVFPWIDERVVVGFALALLVRAIDRGDIPSVRSLLPLAWLLPYLAVRLVFIGDASTQYFLTEVVRDSMHYWAMVPLGWWMAFRAGWAAIAAVFSIGPPVWRPWTVLILTATLLVTVALAADLSRSAAIASPLVLLGCVLLCRRWPTHAARLVLALCLANLLIPTAHVIHQKIDPVSPLPVELFRLFRSR